MKVLLLVFEFFFVFFFCFLLSVFFRQRRVLLHGSCASPSSLFFAFVVSFVISYESFVIEKGRKKKKEKMAYYLCLDDTQCLMQLIIRAHPITTY